ncbi:hypothetical protein DFJ73DRAFT_768897 [Zopfochytrium polystomum]|nr:hypothetical protein DFJ73DRAFT_768897 [Zopfochytrium polystomum]
MRHMLDKTTHVFDYFEDRQVLWLIAILALDCLLPTLNGKACNHLIERTSATSSAGRGGGVRRGLKDVWWSGHKGGAVDEPGGGGRMRAGCVGREGYVLGGEGAALVDEGRKEVVGGRDGQEDGKGAVVCAGALGAKRATSGSNPLAIGGQWGRELRKGRRLSRECCTTVFTVFTQTHNTRKG